MDSTRLHIWPHIMPRVQLSQAFERCTAVGCTTKNVVVSRHNDGSAQIDQNGSGPTPSCRIVVSWNYHISSSDGFGLTP